MTKFIRLVTALLVVSSISANATTKGLSQIVTPDLQPEGDVSLSLQWQDKRIANPYEFQVELGADEIAGSGDVPRIEAFGTNLRRGSGLD